MIGRARTLELLEIVASFGDGGCTAEQFAHAALPDSPYWNALPKNPRRGARRGGRVVSAAAGLLGQLASDRLLKKSLGRYLLTPSARSLLADAGVQVPDSAAMETPKKLQQSGRSRAALIRPQQPARVQWMPDGAGNLWAWDGNVWHFADQYGAHYACYAGQWVCVGYMQASHGSTAANW